MAINSINDLKAVTHASAADFGIDTINKILSADLAQYNAMLVEQMAYLAEPVTVQSRTFGTSATLDMIEIDEFGRAVSKKASVGETVSFPIHVYQSVLGFTEKWMQLHTPAELIERYLQLRRGDSERLLLEVRKAIFNSSNFTQVDPFNGVSLAVKRLLNADSTNIPQFGGSTFTAASHSHYNVCSGSILDVAGVDDVLSDVSEHGMTKGLALFVNSADKANLSGLSKYTALSSDLMVYGNSDSTVSKLNRSDTSNRMIGLWDNQYEIWQKPAQMIPSGYVLAAATGEEEKVLGFRQLEAPSLQGLRIDAMYSNFPLIAQNAERIAGYGVWNRMGAAVVISGSVWANPTLTVSS